MRGNLRGNNTSAGPAVFASNAHRTHTRTAITGRTRPISRASAPKTAQQGEASPQQAGDDDQGPFRQRAGAYHPALTGADTGQGYYVPPGREAQKNGRSTKASSPCGREGAAVPGDQAGVDRRAPTLRYSVLRQDGSRDTPVLLVELSIRAGATGSGRLGASRKD